MNSGFDLQQEADYVFGMMDMYPSDTEIISMLRMKGLSEKEVKTVMEFVRLEGYKKRIRQAKKIFFIGLFITIVLGVTWFFITSSGMYNKKDDFLKRTNSQMLIQPVFFGFLAGLSQMLFGIYRFVTYSNKLKSLKINQHN